MSIYLESAEDINTVFTNWHNSNIDVIKSLLDECSTESGRIAYSNVLNIITEKPVESTFTINEFVMNRTIEFVEDGFQVVDDETQLH